MHEEIALRKVIVEAGIFTGTVVLTYAAAYGASVLWYRVILRADALWRARNQLPAAWFLFNAYLVAGLLVRGALPTGARALAYITLLMMVLTVPVWLWSRLRGRPGRRPDTGSLFGRGALPWAVAWLVQLLAQARPL